MIQKVYPRVYRSGYRQTLFLKLKAEATEAVSVRSFKMGGRVPPIFCTHEEKIMPQEKPYAADQNSLPRKV